MLFATLGWIVLVLFGAIGVTVGPFLIWCIKMWGGFPRRHEWIIASLMFLGGAALLTFSMTHIPFIVEVRSNV